MPLKAMNVEPLFLMGLDLNALAKWAKVKPELTANTTDVLSVDDYSVH